jgi:hypothetical protein
MPVRCGPAGVFALPFDPQFCPHEDCQFHLHAPPGFCISWGSYQPQCRDEPVPRYRCRGCGRTFSRQTFRHDYYERRPRDNVRLFELLSSGVGYRQSGRLLHMSVHGAQYKARKIARTCQHLHRNVSAQLPGGRTFLLDEEETYEQKSIRPLTMPVLIERESWFVVATAVGSIRRRAKRGTRRWQLQEQDEQKHGQRPDQSRQCVEAVLRELDRRLDGQDLVLQTDEKSSYVTLARQVFGDRVQHERTPGRLPRTTYNPLFPINTTLAMTRDNVSRLRRRSWLVSKKGKYLELHMGIFTVYRNYVRRRFNRDPEGFTSAVHLGFLPRNLAFDEVLAWRQHWGRHSIHPLDPNGSGRSCRYETGVTEDSVT